MTTTSDPTSPRVDAADPFLIQLRWVIEKAGGQQALARKAKVSERTIGLWVAGDFPKQKGTAALRKVEQYAGGLDGYPAEAGVPRLTETSGSSWRPTGEPTNGPAAEPPAEPARRLRWRWWWAVAACLVAVVVVLALVLWPGRGTQSGTSGSLPSSAAGPSHDETTGSLGANTFADPRTLTDHAQPIPANTTVSVRCRYYAPSIPSVQPDGYWYLIDSDRWAGRWAPANSFMNGDLPGQPTEHNTDFAVPRCR
jgi:hypothetical protein